MDRELFIDGGWRKSASGARLEIKDPATGEHVGSAAVATAADVDRAVAAAQRAQPIWAETHADERCRIMLKAAALIEERTDAIAMMLTREQGKPVPDSVKEIGFGLRVLRYYAEEGRRIEGSMRPSSQPHLRNLVHSAPVGVVGSIVPWNYPVDIYCWKIGPALAAGCAMVVKPPHETPLATGMIVECLAEAGLPPGVLNDLPGSGEVGANLAAHPGIRMISATASVPAGRSIMRAAAEDMKRVSLELGGQCPFVVLDDADIEEAAAAATRRSFSNMGQICITVNRILVADRIHSKFLEAMSEATRKIELGHGTESGVLYGPVLNESVRTRVTRHIADGLAKGGKLIVGGGPPEGGEYARGFFFTPTLIDGADDDSLPMSEETYGPLAAVRKVKDDREALRVANALPFGLAAYVYSRDLERAWAFAERIESGTVGINVNDTTDIQAPFGGWKLSGMGRELGREGLHAYRETRLIRMRVRPFMT
jgi:succinate-semialdehyde dehydrogenase / glutarate-semialdehyde dehydrogenase